MTTTDRSIWFQNKGSVALESKITRLGTVFSNSSWASDVFVFFHNGMRHEIEDLTNMIQCAAFQKDGFDERELVAFEKWFVDFSYMVAMYFEMEATIVYPALLEIRSGLNGAIERQRDCHKKVVKHLLEIHAECLLFTMSGRRVGNCNFPVEKHGMKRSVDRMHGLAHGLAVNLEQIFEWELNILVPVIRECLMKWEARALVRRCLRDFLAHKIGSEVVWGYFRGVPEEIKEEQLANVDPLRRILLRAKERKWMRTHHAIPRRFEALANVLTPRPVRR
ncbi:unnamed protein product [Agarophyton chilense]